MAGAAAQAPAQPGHPAFHQQGVEHTLGGVTDRPVALVGSHALLVAKLPLYT
jgi:hypothetical protein